SGMAGSSMRPSRSRGTSAVLSIALAVPLPACGSSSQPTSPPPPTSCPRDPEDAWVSDSRLCGCAFARGLGNPRQMAFAPNGGLFVNNGAVVALFDDDHDGSSSSSERSTFATASGLNHGIAFSPDGTYLYASSQTTVYRWRYTSG